MNTAKPNGFPFGFYLASHVPTVVRPVEQRLALAWATGEVTRHARTLYLVRMARHHTPPLDLSLIVFVSPPKVIPTVPLKPPSGIILVYPPLPLPFRE